MAVITADGISLNATHYGAMKEKEGIEAIVEHLKGLETVGINVPKDKVPWAKKVFGLMVKKESPGS